MATSEELERLEYLRSQIEAETISYSELAELQDLAPHIDPGDVLLLQWAGVPEDGTAPNGICYSPRCGWTYGHCKEEPCKEEEEDG